MTARFATTVHEPITLQVWMSPVQKLLSNMI